MSDPARVITVRTRSQPDVDCCIELLREVYAAADTYPSIWPDRPEYWLTPSGFIEAWVALDEVTVVAHVALARIAQPADVLIAACGSEAHMAEVARLFIHPDFRGRGLTEKLLAAAVNRANAVGLIPVIEVNARRARAIRVYERNGWRHIGSRPADWVAPSGERPVLRYFLGPSEK
jgi:GNAT superfamily N-acetyltransferase